MKPRTGVAELLSDSPGVVTLDVAQAELAAEGMRDFYWPVSHASRVAAMKRYLEFFNGYIASCRHADAEILKLCHAYLAVEIATIVQAEYLRDGIADRDVILPAHATSWRLAFDKGAKTVPVPKDMHRGVAPPPAWRRIARIARPSFLFHGLRSRPLGLIPLRRAIVTTGGGPLLFHAARQSARPVYLAPLHEWFYPPTPEELSAFPLRPIDDDLLEDFLTRLQAMFSDAGCEIRDLLLNYLRDWTTQTSSWIRFYLDRLRRAPSRLPSTAWTGSAGIIWNRILSHAVREEGGEVVVFDHALGANAAENSNTAFADCQDCDVFVTFSRPVADVVRRQIPRSVFSPAPPKVLSIEEFSGTRAPTPPVELATRPRPPAFPPRTILYVQPMMITDIGEFVPLMPDIVAADWQVRLLARLRDRGFRVVMKPHPETRAQIADEVLRDLDVEVLEGRFEERFDQGDLLLYDYLPTTTFGAGLMTDRPIVLIDFGFAKLPDANRPVLERRVAIVEGQFDEANRAMVDWRQLDDAIDRSLNLKDSSYAADVLGFAAAAGQ